MEWAAIKQVSTGLTLAAFVVASLLSAYRYHLKNRADVIRSLPDNQRGEALARELNAFGVSAANLSSEQQFQIALKEIELRRSRLTLLTIVAVVLALFSAIVALFYVVKDGPGTSDPSPTHAPVIAGLWRSNSSDNVPMQLTQSGDQITGVLTSSGFEHTVHGNWNAASKEFDMTVDRTGRADHCKTEMFGHIAVQNPETLIWSIVQTSGACGLPAEYSETRVWRRS
jgi:hypothetical protein